jgi:hypothetical protein
LLITAADYEPLSFAIRQIARPMSWPLPFRHRPLLTLLAAIDGRQLSRFRHYAAFDIFTLSYDYAYFHYATPRYFLDYAAARLII